MKEFFRRLHYLLNRLRFDQELASDMEVHREMAARGDGGKFGNELRLREEARDAWGWTWIDRFSQDLRFAARMLRKSPGFTVSAVLMLALGIGVNIAAFGFFNLMVLRPLPVLDPATLLRFQRHAPQSYATALPYPEMAFFREHSKTLSAVLALNASKLSMDGEEKQLNAHFVTANFFTELGATPRLGRMLDSVRDEASNAEPVVVLSHAFWERHFGADPLLLGVGGAAALSRVLRQVLYGVSNLDPLAYLAAIGIFVVVATLAALLPARRALRVDPMRALRYE